MVEALAFLWLSDISVIAYLNDLLLFAPSPVTVVLGSVAVKEHLGEPGVALEPRKIKPGSCPEGQVFRLRAGFHATEDLAPSGKDSEGGQSNEVFSWCKPPLEYRRLRSSNWGELRAIALALGMF